jgi:hypothetical protein
MSLREQFELEQQNKTSSKLELIFLTNNTNYILWLENKINKL